MSLIIRSTKAGSTTQFATSFALGNTLAIADLDTDLNNLVNGVNGSLDSTNIAALGIATANLANLSVTNGKLADLSVGTSKLIDLAVTTAKLNDLGVTTGKLAALSVTYPKLAATAIINNFQTVLGVVGTSDVGQTTIATLPSITTRGTPSKVFLFGTLSLSVISTVSGADVILRWKEDGVSLGNEWQTTVNAGRAPLWTPHFMYTPATAAAHVYTLTVQTSSVNCSVTVAAGRPGHAFVIEIG